MLLAIDPGVHECAFAQFTPDGRLVSWAHAAHDSAAVKFIPTEVIVERPEYQGDRSNRARTQDLMALSWAGAAAAYRYGVPVHDFTPSQWKGSEPKPVHHRRLWDVLDATERVLLCGEITLRLIERAVEKGALTRWGVSGAECYPRGNKMHNVLDAVALGAWFEGRLERR